MYTSSSIVSVDPTSDFLSEQTVYVDICCVEDEDGNLIATTSSTFTTADVDPPTVSFDPADGETDVLVDKEITLTFSELIQNIDDSDITNNNVEALIALKDTDANGSNAGDRVVLDGTDSSSSNAGDGLDLQDGTFGGGIDLSAVDQDVLPSTSDTYDLGSTTRRWNDLYLSGDTIDLAGATISSDGTGTISIAATGATLPANSKAGNNELAVMGSSATGTLSQPIRKVDFFSAAGGLSTANATFEFNAEVADRYSFTDASTFTLANGNLLTDAGITLFQL